MTGFDHFDFLAPYYERLFHAAPAREFLDLVSPENANLLLDVAGGTGRVAQVLSAAGACVVIQDISYKMLLQSAQKDGLIPAQSRAELLPFKDGTFPRIVMVDAFHHVHDQSATARELYRALTPGGRLVVEEPDIRTFYVKLIALGEKLLLMRSHFLRDEQIAAMFHQLGAKVSIYHMDHTVWVVVEKPSVVKN
ncbi:MAG: class I SAM-dependent methyltransferase [Bellilinea sp.]